MMLLMLLLLLFLLALRTGRVLGERRQLGDRAEHGGRAQGLVDVVAQRLRRRADLQTQRQRTRRLHEDLLHLAVVLADDALAVDGENDRLFAEQRDATAGTDDGDVVVGDVLEIDDLDLLVALGETLRSGFHLDAELAGAEHDLEDEIGGVHGIDGIAVENASYAMIPQQKESVLDGGGIVEAKKPSIFLTNDLGKDSTFTFFGIISLS